MAKLKIDRLTLDMKGWSENDAARLSHLVANRLAGEVPTARESVRIDNVRLNLQAGPNTTLEQLADRIVERLIGQVRTTL